MKIAFDIQPLFEQQKTGVGWVTEMHTKCALQNKENKYYINFFSLRKNKAEEIKKDYKEHDHVFIQWCRWMPLRIYRRLWNYVPLPYGLFMSKEVDITQFFNFVIPPGAKGLKSVMIHDMVWKAMPDTMDDANKAVMDKNMASAAERADFILTISEFSKKEIIKYLHVPEDKIYVVPNGVELERFHNHYERDRIETVKHKFGIQGDYILYLGTLEPRKNIPALVDAYYKAYIESSDKEKFPFLVIAGKKGWKYQEIFEKVKNYGIEKRVIFTGYVTDEEAPLLMSGAEMFVFPSLYEGFGLPPLEAMACGTPVITSKHTSLPEVVGDAGITIDEGDTEELAKAIAELQRNPELRERYREKGLERAKSYSWENSAKILNEVYKKVLEKH